MAGGLPGGRRSRMRTKDNYQYIYPPNARRQDQLDIMMRLEGEGKDPLDVKVIEQEVLFETESWYVSRNRFPYRGAKQHFLVVANRPAYALEEVTPEMWQDLPQVLARITRDYGLEGGGLFLRFGDPACSGASLKRLHWHVVQPQEGEKVQFGLGGKRELAEGLHL